MSSAASPRRCAMMTSWSGCATLPPEAVPGAGDCVREGRGELKVRIEEVSLDTVFMDYYRDEATA